MSTYNLTEYSDNYCNKLLQESLWQFKEDDLPANNFDLTIVNSESFKYKAALVWKTTGAVDNTNTSVKNTKIFVLLKYLSNF